MNKTLITFMLLVAGTALAASDPILATGQPPLMRSDLTKFVSLVEWTLDVHFTAAERDALDKGGIEAWNRNEPQFRQKLLKGVSAYDAVNSLPAAQKVEVRKQMQLGFFDGMRAAPDAPFSKLAMAAYNREHGLSAKK